MEAESGISRNLLEEFLVSVDKCFPVPLSNKQNLHEYAGKLCEKATLCMEMRDGRIVSMVAGYTENVVNQLGYISVVATSPDARGQGLASKLVREFIAVAHSARLSAIHLYADAENYTAVRMYRKIGFVDYVVEKEPRPEDLHLIYHISERRTEK